MSVRFTATASAAAGLVLALAPAAQGVTPTPNPTGSPSPTATSTQTPAPTSTATATQTPAPTETTTVTATPTTPPPTTPPPTTPSPEQPTTAPPQQPAPISTALKWTRCGTLQCAQVVVPLDYAHPETGTTTLNVARRPADRSAKKKGVVFINPGGPGGSASAAVPDFAQILGRDIRRNYDIVGVDPRATFLSEVPVCEGEQGQQWPAFPDHLFPLTEADVTTQLAADAFLRGLCARNTPKLLSHMTTADVARDMDRVRALMGQKTINYYGVSYGSYLGSTYAAMFPNRSRAMVVDGVIDPVAWATGRPGQQGLPLTTRVNSHQGAQEALDAAIDECEVRGTRSCAESDTIREDWNAYTAELKKRTLAGDRNLFITYDQFMALALSTLYDGEGIPEMFQFVHEARKELDSPAADQRAQSPGAKVKALHARLLARDAENRKNKIAYDPPVPADGDEVNPPPSYAPIGDGVLCTDGPNPSDPRAWVRAAAAADRVAPGFGSIWTWSSSICAGWPAKGVNRYTGPFDSKPAGGMLVMTSKYDPATPRAGAIATHRLVRNSRLVLVNGWGHATIDTSGCATKIRNAYISTGKLPTTDRVCRADHELFTPLD